eukprot:CAMPEP_0173381804 /NCGR_PEP_ID=MMETSP1356-20130122/4237_1 /TAXON_ID=77927 ORGANISM="Hemiselmis virescens, Strain PCC157" /NCGR_SAMPLE_ID=MMETSP1356 /ASSEMBLY_ACC=CAM_ASM_000847 /LENGTH=241 /DNA_ID=CAMNT_0014335821 /DNA_START=73 /DNA_END=795 /DNA_ORIENTATION=-
MAQVTKNGESGNTVVQDAQGNTIYPCGYRGGAKERLSAPVEFEEGSVSLSSQIGIAQVEKDKALQAQDALMCLSMNTILSEEAMDNVKKMCGPGYEVDKAGVVTPIEPEAEGSNLSKGPGYFYQPHALAAGMGTEGFLGDDAATLTQDDLAVVCKLVEDDQKEIKAACFQYLLQYFKGMDEEGKGVLVGDAFKTAIGKLEEEMPMEAKDAPWMTPAAAALIEEAGAEGTIDYEKFLMGELA